MNTHYDLLVTRDSSIAMFGTVDTQSSTVALMQEDDIPPQREVFTLTGCEDVFSIEDHPILPTAMTYSNTLTIVSRIQTAESNHTMISPVVFLPFNIQI